MNEPSSAPPIHDRYASLRKAREALASIENGQALPEEKSASVAAAVNAQPRVFKARTPSSADAPQSSMASAVVSKPYDPSSSPPEPARFSPRLVPTKEAVLGFDALKLAHMRVGRDVSRQDGENASTSGSPVVAVDHKFFESVSNEAKLGRLYKLVDQTAVYYKADPVDTEKEKAFLATLSGMDLDGMAVAYEVAAKHVMVMTSDLHAQQVALAKNKELFSFYKKHGTTEDQLDNERSERQASSGKSQLKR